MPVKLQLLNVFYTIQVKSIKLGTLTTVPLKWTGWFKNKKEVLQLLLQQQLVSGKVTESILSIHRVTLTSQLKQKDLLEFLTVQLLYSMRKAVQNHNQKLFGDKLINMAYQEFASSIKWMQQALIISCLLTLLEKD